jgi:hypothetical protein
MKPAPVNVLAVLRDALSLYQDQCDWDHGAETRGWLDDLERCAPLLLDMLHDESNGSKWNPHISFPWDVARMRDAVNLLVQIVPRDLVYAAGDRVRVRDAQPWIGVVERVRSAPYGQMLTLQRADNPMVHVERSSKEVEHITGESEHE